MTANGKKPKAEPAPPTTLFLFGAHGDLVKRLLMPALYNLSRDGLLGDGLRIVGVDHNAISDADFAKKLEDFIRTEAASKVKGNAENALDPALWEQLAKGISYVEVISSTTAPTPISARRLPTAVLATRCFTLPLRRVSSPKWCSASARPACWKKPRRRSAGW